MEVDPKTCSLDTLLAADKKKKQEANKNKNNNFRNRGRNLPRRGGVVPRSVREK